MMKKETNRMKLDKGSRWLIPILMVLVAFVVILAYRIVVPKGTDSAPKIDETYIALPEDQMEPGHPDYDKIENGVHVRTGFVEGEGMMLVVNNCTNCHSAKLVTQNRMTKEQWMATIRWMQETQNLWSLGANEEPIVNYLANYYAPIAKGRRQNLTAVEWYELEP